MTTAVEKAVIWTLSRRVTIFVLAITTLVLGVIVYRRMSIELLPRGMTQNQISVFIPVNAANPAEVQESIIRPTEELIRTIPGVTKLNSRARPNNAGIDVTFSKEIDINLAAAEVRDRVERARVGWPQEVRQYSIFRFNIDTDLPVYSFGIELDHPTDELTFVVEEKILKPLEAIPGVARVTCWGLLEDQLRIYIDRDKALAAGMSLYEITQKLQFDNVDTSGGEVEEGGLKYTVRSVGRFRSTDDVKEFPLRPGLTLGQIATIEPEKAVRDFVVLSGRTPTLWCQVQKESTANIVETCNRVRDALQTRIATDERLKELGVRFVTFDRMDFGHMIGDALKTLGDTCLDGAWLSVVVLLYFLRRIRLTAIITLAIPMSLLMTAMWMAATGSTVNILSLLGVTISIGMLVDNAIVVVECIQQKREAGMPGMEAAWRGTAEVALAVTLSTLTTVVAFLPLIFMSGDQEITFFTSNIGLPLCYAVLASLVVALVFVPLGTVFFYPKGDLVTRNRILRRIRNSRFVEKMTAAYGMTLEATLRHRFVSILLMVSVSSLLTWIAWTNMGKTSIRNDNGGGLSIRVEVGANFTLNDSYKAFVTLGEALEAMKSEITLTHYWCFLNKRSGDIWLQLAERDPNKTKAYADIINKRLPRLPGVKTSCGMRDDGMDKSKITFRVFGPDVMKLAEVSRDVADVIASVPGVLTAKSDLEPAEDEVHILPDRAKLQRLGIVPEALWGTVQYGVRGFPLRELAAGEREIPLIVQMKGGDTQTLTELRDTALRSMTGTDVPMSAVANLTVTRGFGEIRREQGKARALIKVDAAIEDTASLTSRIRERLKRHNLPEGFSYEDTQGVDFTEGMRNLVTAVVMGFVFVFLIMGIMFESFLLPIAVAVSVPFSWAAAIWALALADMPIDFVGAISAIVLVGVVVNNGIVLIDCAHRLRHEGQSQLPALVNAGRLRLRPILMTALTTIVGLVPTAMVKASGSQISYQSLAVALIGGLSVSTLLTLYVTPISYSLLDDFRGWFGGLVRALIRPGVVDVPSATVAAPPPNPSGL